LGLVCYGAVKAKKSPLRDENPYPDRILAIYPDPCGFLSFFSSKTVISRVDTFI
jgi:hypothetical protein